MMKNKGFTLIEMIFCISVILVILLLVIPYVTNKNRIVKDKGCQAQIEVVTTQPTLLRSARSGPSTTTIVRYCGAMVRLIPF